MSLSLSLSLFLFLFLFLSLTLSLSLSLSLSRFLSQFLSSLCLCLSFPLFFFVLSVSLAHVYANQSASANSVSSRGNPPARAYSRWSHSCNKGSFNFPPVGRCSRACHIGQSRDPYLGSAPMRYPRGRNQIFRRAHFRFRNLPFIQCRRR